MPFQFLLQGYSTLPGYGNRNGKEAVRPITIWKGNSYATISARDPAFSGKDSGKGDSDFNDSDSDVSGDAGLKKDAASAPPMGGPNGKKRREKGSRSPPFRRRLPQTLHHVSANKTNVSIASKRATFARRRSRS